MKILQIFHRNPYPPIGGAEIVTYNTTKYLVKQGHDTTVLSQVETKKRIPEIEKFLTWKPVEKDTSTSVRDILSNLPSKTPYVVSRYYSDKVVRKIRAILDDGDFDLVHIESLYAGVYGLQVKREFDIPVVLREHNYETKLIESRHINQPNPFTKLYWFIQYKKTERFEKKVSETLDHCIMISEKDELELRENSPGASTSVVPGGVDTSYFIPRGGKTKSKSLVFVGTMDWAPNVEGLMWFEKKVLPLIKENSPGVKFYIVGKNPSREIRSLEEKNTVVTGYVDDVREYMARGQVFIAPLKTGSGMRIKILNAMAMKKPVVSTSVGCEGINVTEGRDILIGDKPEEFANQTLNLLQNEKKRKEIAKAGLNLVKENYRWEKVTKKMVSEYRKVIRDQDE